MHFIVETPTGCRSERTYVLGVIFNDWLGLPCRLYQTERDNVSIRLTDQSGEICLPDRFFFHMGRNWLAPESLPEMPLLQWDTGDLASDILLTDRRVPVLYGDSLPHVSKTDIRQGARIVIPIDILGSSFFMLSRYEEAVILERDNHDRFPSAASLAFRAEFLDRPIIDEYVEILWAAMQKLWPGLTRKTREARTLVTCDVDHPFDYHGRLKGLSRRLAGDLLKRRSPRTAARTMLGTLNAYRGRHDRDPYRDGLDFIMEINERVGRTVGFYFIPENTDSENDNRVSLDEPRMRQLLSEIHARNHEIGIHSGYNTYKHPEAMRRSVTTLRRVLEEEHIVQPILGGRQHFLRWETSTTAELLDANGLDYDSTLSYADRPGFRCGTCREYPMYDLFQRRALKLRQRPLIVMESSVIAEQYMGMGYSDEALKLMLGYRDICHRFGGDFGLLWHNSHFLSVKDKSFYAALVE
jgi:hypothetical protein